MNSLKGIRTKKGFSLYKIAKEVKTTTTQIKRLEEGERKLTVEWATRIAKVLGCTPAEILGFQNLGIDSLPTSETSSKKEPDYLTIKYFNGMATLGFTEVKVEVPQNKEISLKKDGDILYVLDTNNYVLAKIKKPKEAFISKDMQNNNTLISKKTKKLYVGNEFNK